MLSINNKKIKLKNVYKAKTVKKYTINNICFIKQNYIIRNKIDNR